MENLKNMVVLKNLPSNLIDEAFLILKPNQRIESFEYSPKQEEQSGQERNSKEYIVKEAEMVISSYLNKNDIAGKRELQMLKAKNKKLKIATLVFASLTVVVTLIGILV